MKSIKLHEHVEVLNSNQEKYIKAFEIAEESFNEAYQLFNNPEFETKQGWKIDTQSNDATVYTKPYKNGQMFLLTSVLEGSLDTVYNITIEELETAPSWNANLVFAKVVAKLSENVDITHYANPDVLIVKSRDFVTVRSRQIINNQMYVACRSVDLDDIKETKNHVRGKLIIGCGRMTPEGDNKTKIEYILSIDFRGLIPKSIINSALGKTIIKDFEQTQQQLKKMTQK